MAINLGKLVSKVFTAGVEGGMTAARAAGQVAKGAARLYNSLAEQVPIPLPRIPDGTSYEKPNEVYQPPPPPPRPKPKAPPAPEPPRPNVKAAPKTNGGGLTVEKAGPSAADYQKARKAEPAKPAEAPKKADAPKQAEAPKKAEAPKPAEAPKKAEAPKPAEAPKQAEAPSAANLDKLRKAELQKMLDQAGTSYPAKATKKDLIALIRGE